MPQIGITKQEFIDQYNEGHRDFTRLELPEVDLTFVILDEVILEHAALSGAVLKRSCFRNAKLAHADLTNAKVIYTDLTDADLRFVDFTDADLKGAQFTLVLDENGFNLEGVQWPADPNAFEGATLDGEPFLEMVLILQDLEKNPGHLRFYESMQKARNAMRAGAAAGLGAGR